MCLAALLEADLHPHSFIRLTANEAGVPNILLQSVLNHCSRHVLNAKP
jgi:hypothetical protein